MTIDPRWVLAGAIGFVAATVIVSYFKRRAKRTPETWDDDLADAFEDGLKAIKEEREE